MSLLDCQKEEKMNKNMENDNGKGKGKKKTTRISLGGDIGRLVVVGGALVIGGLLMAAFGIKRNKTRDSNKNPTIAVTKASQDQGSQGLRCLLQTSSSPIANSSCEGRGNITNSVITREQILTTEIDGPMISKMVLLPDSRGKGITKLSSDFGALQDKYDTEDSIPVEIIEAKNNGETSAVDQDPDVYSAEDVEEEEESVVGNIEGSEDTGDSSSSRDSNADAIWPAEMIDDTMPELEEACQPQRSGEEDETIQKEKHTQSIRDNGFNNCARENMTIDEDVSMFWVRIFSKLMLLMFLLFIFPIPDMVCLRF